jgi:hypothetical protein
MLESAQGMMLDILSLKPLPKKRIHNKFKYEVHEKTVINHVRQGYSNLSPSLFSSHLEAWKNKVGLHSC